MGTITTQSDAPKCLAGDELEDRVDLATLIGMLLGIACVAIALFTGGSLTAYVDIPSALIVLGGAAAATMMSFPLERFFQLPVVTAKALFNKPMDTLRLIEQLVELAEVARRDGILALESLTEEMEEPFLVNGLRMAVDGSDPEVIESIMETELENLMDRHEAGRGMLEAVGRYAPAFGMIGTLVGLVAMLANMEDPSQIGAGMATTLITTLYGSLLANVVFLPMADKLAIRSNEEVLNKTLVIQGVMAIQSGDNPRNIESKLMTFLPPSVRASVEARKKAA